MKKAISILANLVLVVCVLLLAAALLTPSLLHVTLDNVLSGSMEPTIHTGALIAMEKVNPADIKVGDVIGFRVKGLDLPVCHRVVELVDTEEGSGFVTKGDANEAPDPGIVRPEDVIGRVVFDLPYIGYIAHFIKTPYGFGLLLGLPALIIITMELRNILRPKGTRRKRPKLLRKKPGRLPAYLVIVVGLVLTGVLWGMMAGQTQQRTLGSFAEKSQEADQPLYSSKRVMQNKGKFPLIICLFSADKTVSISESSFRLRPGTTKEIEIGGDSEAAIVGTGCFFPLLPQKTLYRLFTWNPRIAPLVAAAAWTLPLTIATFVILVVFASRPGLARRAKYMKEMLSYD